MKKTYDQSGKQLYFDMSAVQVGAAWLHYQAIGCAAQSLLIVLECSWDRHLSIALIALALSISP